MKRYIFFGALMVCASAFSADVGLDSDEKRVCDEGGGCFLITQAKFNNLVTAAYKMGMRDGYQNCKSGS